MATRSPERGTCRHMPPRRKSKLPFASTGAEQIPAGLRKTLTTARRRRIRPRSRAHCRAALPANYQRNFFSLISAVTAGPVEYSLAAASGLPSQDPPESPHDVGGEQKNIEVVRFGGVKTDDYNLRTDEGGGQHEFWKCADVIEECADESECEKRHMRRSQQITRSYRTVHGTRVQGIGGREADLKI
jgi:hypothetical protein